MLSARNPDKGWIEARRRNEWPAMEVDRVGGFTYFRVEGQCVQPVLNAVAIGIGQARVGTQESLGVVVDPVAILIRPERIRPLRLSRKGRQSCCETGAQDHQPASEPNLSSSGGASAFPDDLQLEPHSRFKPDGFGSSCIMGRKAPLLSIHSRRGVLNFE